MPLTGCVDERKADAVLQISMEVVKGKPEPPVEWVRCRGCGIGEDVRNIHTTGVLIGCEWRCPRCASRLLELAKRAGLAF